MTENRSPVRYLKESLEIIRLTCTAYRAGNTACYRVLAVELRLLLCDRKREHNRWHDSSLAVQVFPQMLWDPILGILEHREPAEHSSMPLNDWLSQPIWQGRSIKQIIKLICEKDGGAHVDPAGIPWNAEETTELAEITCLLAEYVLIKLEQEIITGGNHD